MKDNATHRRTNPPTHEPDGNPDLIHPAEVAYDGRNGGSLENVEARLEQDLSPEHLRMLRESSGISPDDILARSYFTATDPDQLRELGFAEYQLRTPALVVPVHSVQDGPLFYRARPDDPRERKNDPGK